MRTYHLDFQAQLQGCSHLAPVDTEDYPHDYTFTIECGRCGFIHPKNVVATTLDKVEVLLFGYGHKGRRYANFSQKCHDCHNLMYFIITRTPHFITESDVWVSLAEISTHGCGIRDYILDDQFQVTGTKGNIIDGIDLTSGDFCEFDKESNRDILIANVKWRINFVAGNSTLRSLDL